MENGYSHMHTHAQIIVVKCTQNHTRVGTINTKFRIMITSGKKGEGRNEGQSFKFLESILIVCKWRKQRGVVSHHQQAIPTD